MNEANQPANNKKETVVEENLRASDKNAKVGRGLLNITTI